MIIKATWITVVILELIHASRRLSRGALHLLDLNQLGATRFVVIHDNSADRMSQDGGESIKFLPYQLSMVVYWTTMALTGDGELGFGSGEGA